MPNRAKSICRKAGCNVLIDSPGYCEKHSYLGGWKALDAKKTPEQRKFYSSYRWVKTSKEHRQLEPLCRRCKAEGLVVPAQLVHHVIPVEELIAKGLSVYDHQYLESLCIRCHNKIHLHKRG
jgi:5-methylcytosine-specific restriction protein A